MDQSPLPSANCITCGTALQGKYCHQCGEKTVHESDFKLGKLLSQAFDNFTHIDGKVFKSFGWLVTKPWALSEAYLIGRRKPFMKPFQLFIVVNLILFIFFNDLDVFRIPWYELTKYPKGFGFNMEHIMEVNKDNLAELGAEYDHTSSTLSKGLMILVIPFIALLLFLTNFRSKLPFGKHVVIASHYFSFHLLFILTFGFGIMLLLQTTELEQRQKILILFTFMAVVLGFYLTMIQRRLYNNSWFWAITKGLILGLIIPVFSIEVYRKLITKLALSLVT